MITHRFPVYGWLMLTGIIVTLVFWTRLAKRDERLLFIYIAGLTGAFVGAKIVYILAEGWLWFGTPYMWLMLATGKSIVGALLGGYAAVEITKRMIGYRSVTGDWFAMLVPVGVLIGRVGCLVQGCCLGSVCAPAWYTIRDIEGVPRWPSVPVEMLFNALAIIIFFILRRKRMFTGQHFHLYLIGYGLFRFAHEFMRDTPRILGILSGYQIAALAVAALGIIGFERRRRGNSGNPALVAQFQ
jgi:phosphatidylglycerol:prolipoprotein diacylglycerol transferase